MMREQNSALIIIHYFFITGSYSVDTTSANTVVGHLLALPLTLTSELLCTELSETKCVIQNIMTRTVDSQVHWDK